MGAEDPMTDDVPLSARIGSRLRQLRKSSGRSLASVAQQLGISSSALSQIETGVMQPSVNRLVELVGVLGAPVSAIFDELEVYQRPVGSDAPDVAEPLPGVFVSAADDPAVAHLGQGVTYRRLTPTALPGIELFESSYPPGTSSSVDGAMLVHAGYECGSVVEGVLTFEFSEGELRLGPGASLSFAATRPHRVVNETDEVAVAVWLTLPGGLPEPVANATPAPAGS
jgi:transcriptional regulator with XRE-family HTH domain